MQPSTSSAIHKPATVNAQQGLHIISVAGLVGCEDIFYDNFCLSDNPAAPSEDAPIFLDSQDE